MVNQQSAASFFTDHGTQVSSFIGRSLSELQRSSEAEIPTRSGRSNILWAFSIVSQPVSFRSILNSLLRCFALVSQTASSISATPYFAPIEENAHNRHHKSVSLPRKSLMGTLNRTELDRLERRELQLTILAAAFVLVQAAGLAMFMYPLVFLHPIGNKWTLRASFFGFCALTLLFVGYLLERQRTVRQLKQQILAELERNVTLQHQASVDLLQTMPDQNHFWDRLTMEYRRAMTMQRTLSILLVKAKPVGSSTKEQDGTSEAWSDAAKAMSRKLRPTDSIYRLATDTFALVLPETDVLNAKRVAIRLQEELQTVRAKHGVSFDITAHNYPEHVKSAHELEDIVKSLLPEQDEFATSAPVPAAKS